MKRARGNILFLILLAVVLFAALSYAVTSSMRGGGRDSGAETAKTGAASVLQWFAAVDAALMRMNLVKGIKYEDISFRYDALYNGGAPLNTYGHNTRCTTNECQVFHPDGGGAAPPDFTKHSLANPVDGIATNVLGPGYVMYIMMQWPGAGTDLNDVVGMVQLVKGSVCDALNETLGITAIPVRSAGSTIYARDVANWDNPTYTITGNASQLYGKNMYAGTYNGSGDARRCYVYRLVIER